MPLTESHIENLTLRWLEDVGWQVTYGSDIGPDGNRERPCYETIILENRLKQAIKRLNPTLSEDGQEEAFQKITAHQGPSLLEENQQIHQWLVNGIEVTIQRNGTYSGEPAKLIDFDNPNNNDWLAVNQFTVIENQQTRRPDVVLFVNGLPLVVMELKNPVKEMATVDGAVRQLAFYERVIPSLFRTNAFLITSDGLYSQVGLTSFGEENHKNFMNWPPPHVHLEKNHQTLEMLVRGLLSPLSFLRFIQHFIMFDNGHTKRKIMAAYHQYYGVNEAVQRTYQAIQNQTGKIGVVWHTQGSGKSFFMIFYAAQIIHAPFMKNPTLVVVTDRLDLDNQLFQSFSNCSNFLGTSPQQVESRGNLRERLNVASGGIIFTTMQKFMPEKGEKKFPQLTNRHNVVVLIDEAHRTQYGFQAKIKNGETAYGYAKNLRDALPNASFIAFTGTPIEKTDVNTTAVFGHYIHQYTMQDAVADGVTVPIHYQGCLPELHLKHDELDRLDQAVESLLSQSIYDETKHAKGRFLKIEQVLGAQPRLEKIARHLVNDFEKRQEIIDGKAMVVCSSRENCVKLYNEIVKIRSHWCSDDDLDGLIKVVITSSPTQDPLEWLPHTGHKKRFETLAKRMKDPEDPLKIVIVRDMWLTGFDVPCLNTLYVDKYMQEHGLMQAIARVNRTSSGKDRGLIIDYIGLMRNLQKALNTYKGSTDENPTVEVLDEHRLIDTMLSCHEIVCRMFHGFSFQETLKNGTSEQRLQLLAAGLDWILKLQEKDSTQEKTEEAKRKAKNRFPKATVDLWSAYLAAISTKEAQKISLEVAFFEAIRIALFKGNIGAGKPNKAFIHQQIQQFINQAIGSTEIIDILEAGGLQKGVQIFSEEFLNKIRNSPYKNLAMEGLKVLLADEIQKCKKKNKAAFKRFSERLKSILDRYHNDVINFSETQTEMEELARDIALEDVNMERLHLTNIEMGYYGAIQSFEHHLEVDMLCELARSIALCIQENAGLDWVKSQEKRAKLRIAVKKLLKKIFPVEYEAEALENIMEQAEAFTP
jgi:type I restriction enzyme R subunit